ncbi:MAG: nucleoside-diphosphate sugar epimerase/dehydratase [Desulfomonilaceae bacterium]|nr:nucleoside-diphosphate sugar epimerase/dehydratase [Desulfomonilaceae bacterium]
MSRIRVNHRLYQVLKRSETILTSIARYIRFNHLLFAAVFLLSGAGFWLSYEFRFDFDVPAFFNRERLLLLPYMAVFKLALFYVLGMHSTNWRYVGLADLPRLLLFGLIGSCALVVVRVGSNSLIVPKGVILIDFLLTLVLVGGARVGIRFLRETTRAIIGKGESANERQAVIIGAGDSGEMIAREIVRNPRSGLRARAFFDDDKGKRGLSIHGIPVVGGVDDVSAYVEENPVRMAIIAIPSANSAQMKRIYHITKTLNISVKTLPALHEIIQGAEKLRQLRDIDITDLLGREEVHIDDDQVRGLICDRIVVVTGAGGSIGSELSRQILKRDPRRVILIERSENSLFHIHRQLSEMVGDASGTKIVPILCDVRDEIRVRREFERFRPHLVFHAGAHKHVPMQELNSGECVKNNVGGMRTLTRVSHEFGVSSFVLISTDKAVKPRSVMGASKRICELYGQAFSRMSETKFMSVRFGNVLASEGSVVPLFLDQIAKGGPVRITHPEMRRYFMTIPEAVTLVLQAAALGKSGQILVLEMGEPIRIHDMVQQLVQLVGKDPEDIPIEFIGLRPGEKLLEELYTSGEFVLETGHKKIAAYDQPVTDPDKIVAEIDGALELVDGSTDNLEVRRILKKLVPEYTPQPDASVLSDVAEELTERADLTSIPAVRNGRGQT